MIQKTVFVEVLVEESLERVSSQVVKGFLHNLKGLGAISSFSVTGLAEAEAKAKAEQARKLAATGLTPREKVVLFYLAKGFNLEEIAETLSGNRHTIASQVKSIYFKLGINSRAEAAVDALKLGLHE